MMKIISWSLFAMVVLPFSFGLVLIDVSLWWLNFDKNVSSLTRLIFADRNLLGLVFELLLIRFPVLCQTHFRWTSAPTLGGPVRVRKSFLPSTKRPPRSCSWRLRTTSAPRRSAWRTSRRTRPTPVRISPWGEPRLTITTTLVRTLMWVLAS